METQTQSGLSFNEISEITTVSHLWVESFYFFDT